ncbi:MAG: hypothetical protein ACI4JE_06720 [Ruminococcus sp.]|nr:hypothetical protein [Oscillospiraceae bacterium]
MNRLIIPAVLSFALLSGCSPVNVQERQYLRAVKIDGSKYEFTFFGESGDICEAEGETPDEALRSAEIQLGKEIFTGHAELAVLGSCNKTDTLCMLLNEWKFPPSCLVIYDENADLSQAGQLIDALRLQIDKYALPDCDIVTELGRC